MQRSMVKRDLANPPALNQGDAKAPAGRKLVGYAAKFGTEYFPFGPNEKFVETIDPGAFARTLAENPDVRALFNHDTNCVLGRTSSGTLRLTVDQVGLAYEVDLPDTTFANDLKAMVERRDVTGCSFGFCIVEHKMTQRADGMTVCTLLDVDLYEISTGVTFPAYEDTSIEVRSKRQVAPAGRPLAEAADRRLRLIEVL